MTFLIQHGYGKAQKIPVVQRTGNLDGVILSPGDEDSGALRDTAQFCRSNNLRAFIDPQTYYYSTQPAGRGRTHSSHGLEFGGLSWAQDAKSISAHIDRVGSLNQAINPDGYWIAPGPLQDSFADIWTPLSVQLARTSGESWGAGRTIATLAVDESGLSSWPTIERWLDVATTLPVQGFYILISRPATAYPSAPWAPAKLANLLRLIHALGELNEFEVIWGYSDFEGLLGLAAGAHAMATGWSYTLRQFSATKWMSPAGGGRPATVRTHLNRLWALPRAETETAQMFNSELRAEIFTEAEITHFENTPFSSLTRADAQVEHMSALAARANKLSTTSDLTLRVSELTASLGRALRLFGTIDQAGLLIEPLYRNRVNAFRTALSMFADQVAL